MNAVVDNDILFKGVCYGILGDLLAAHNNGDGAIGILGAARFVIPKKIQRAKLQGSAESAEKQLMTFFSQFCILEPTTDEQVLAAEFELAGQKLGVALDVGESQLCAIVATRIIPLLLTGDKRAIIAIEKLLGNGAKLEALCGKIRCLEQVLVSALGRTEVARMRLAVCAEPEVDKVVTICFACSSQEVSRDEVMNGLHSYINDLRLKANRVLAE
jgi:hypothetical protein